MVQSPTPSRLALLPVTEQTAGVADANVTVRPDGDALATSGTVLALNARSAGSVKLIACAALATVSVKAWLLVPDALLARKVRLWIPALPVAGVPAITPVVGSSTR